MMKRAEPNQTHESVLDVLKNENISPEHKANLERIFAVNTEGQSA